jgi:hypothetical protein
LCCSATWFTFASPARCKRPWGQLHPALLSTCRFDSSESFD